MFDQLKRGPVNRRLRLETAPDALTTRVIDLVAPLGKGSRALVVGPPGTGKTTLIQHVACALRENHPECHVFVLMLGAAAEDVTAMRRAVGPTVEVVATGFDASDQDHIRVSNATLDRAKELVVAGKDVVLVLDSLSRLARALVHESPPSGRLGAVPVGYTQARDFFRSGCSIDGGGSLTFLAALAIDTDSRLDNIVFEELKGTGDTEIHLDRRLVAAGVWPAIDVNSSGTRRDELLRPAWEHDGSRLVRAVLADMYPIEVMELLLSQLKKFPTNTDFLWSLCDDPDRLLSHIREAGRVSDRKRQLYAVACCRRLVPLLYDTRVAGWLDVAECRADGRADNAEVEAVVADVRESSQRVDSIEMIAVYDALLQTVSHAPTAAEDASRQIRYAVDAPETGGEDAPESPDERAAHCELLRDIFGNPSRPANADPSWLTSTVVALARGIYDEKAFDRMPILADALQDAGCENGAVLNHCRGSGPHVRGCWVVDLLLGKA